MTTVERLRALYEAGTKGPLTLMRYEHGGGRLYKEEPRTLVADFYHEADRELLTAMHAALPHLLAVAEAAERIKEEANVQIRTYTDGSESVSFDPHGVNLLGLMKALHHLNAGKKEE